MSTPVLTDNVVMQQRRGPSTKLPLLAPAGQLIVTTDTNELYVGTGAGIVQIASGNNEVILFQDTEVSGATIYADAVRPVADPSSRDGWYFKNDGLTGTEHIDTYPGLTTQQKAIAKKKINWWFFAGAVYPAKVSDLKYAYAVFTADTTGKPFFVMYTTAGKTHLYQASTNLVAGKSYVYYFGTEPPPATLYPALPRVQLIKTNTTVPLVATEDIYLIGYHTDSGATQNSVQLQTYMLGFKTTTSKQNFVLKTSTNTGFSGSTYTFNQTSPSTTWVVNHNMSKRPSVTTVDTSGNVILGQVIYNSDNQITVEFNPAVAGSVYLN